MAYATIVFMQGEEATPFLEQLQNDQVSAVYTQLKQMDYGHESEVDIVDYEPWGIDDKTVRLNEYTLAWNANLEYVSLTRKLDDEE